jgi:hypothetical protein
MRKRGLVLSLAGPMLLVVGCTTSPGSVFEVSPAIEPLSYPLPQTKKLGEDRPQSILFIGNSYFYYNDSLHNHVSRMVVAAGLFDPTELTYKSATIGGAALRDHAIDHLLEPSNLRVDSRFDVVILQGGSAAPLTEDRRRDFAETVDRYAQKITANGGKPVLYMTHAYVKPHRRYRPDMIDDIASLYIDTGNRSGALVIPVGLAFAEAYRRNPDIQLHKSFDGSHPSLLGTYLAASTVLASIYGISPVGNSYDYYGAIDQADALFLQTVAQDTVSRFYRQEN